MKFFTYVGSFQVVFGIFILVSFISLFCIEASFRAFIIWYCCYWNAHYKSGLKTILSSSRPDLHRLIEIGGYSFPSGHAMNAFAVYGILSFCYGDIFLHV